MNMEKDHQDSSATVERSDSADKQGSLDCNSVSSIFEFNSRRLDRVFVFLKLTPKVIFVLLN